MRLLKAVVALLFLCNFNLHSQENTSTTSVDETGELRTAEALYSEEDYSNALPHFLKLRELHPNDPYFELMVGICYTHSPSDKQKSIPLLEEVVEKNKTFSEAKFYLGNAYAVNNKFDQAIQQFEAYLKDPMILMEDREKTEHIIFNCKNAKKFFEDSLGVEIQHMGSPVNSKYSEYVPLISADESVLIFTYRGEGSIGGKMDKNGKPDPEGQYYEDIYITYKNFNGEWGHPKSIADNINTIGQDASIALSIDGQKLLIYKSGPKDHGDIYESNLEGENWTRPKKLNGDINTHHWEGSASLSSDLKTIYFSSDRPDGKGGRDLYTAHKLNNGGWSQVTNLSSINTKYNEDAPYIHADNKTLYFSSEGHNSMGGYDIFYTVYEDGSWTVPENVGYPVNTSGDDRYYVLSADGNTGYYSTSGQGGLGEFDLFTVTPGNFGHHPTLALVIGDVFINKEPVEANINVTNMTTGEIEGQYTSNSYTGKYTLALTPGNHYKIAIEVEGFKPQIEYLSVDHLDSYVQVKHDFDLGKVDTSTNSLQSTIDREIERIKIESTKTGYESERYKKVLANEGDKQEGHIQYYVDLGAYEKVKQFDDEKYNNLLLLKTKDVDNPGKIRVNVGPFSTFKEAEQMRQQIASIDSSHLSAQVMVNDWGIPKSIKEKFKSYYEDDAQGFAQKEAIVSTESSKKNLKDESTLEVGTEEIDGLSFKIEIASVSDTNNFNFAYLEKYGEIKRKQYPDGSYKYFLGNFNALKEAEEFRTKLEETEPDVKETLVTVFVINKKAEREDPVGAITPQGDLKMTFVSEKENFVEKINDQGKFNISTLPNGNLIIEDNPQHEYKDAVDTSKTILASVNTSVKIATEPKLPKTKVEKTVTTKKEVLKETLAFVPAKNSAQIIPEKTADTLAAVSLKLNNCDSVESTDLSAFIGKDLNDPVIYSSFVTLVQDFCVENLEFKVQIAAYRYPKNYDFGFISDLENVEIVLYNDGVTRFTMGRFNTIKDAEALRQKAISKGQKDAWITPFYKGNRMYMEELIEQNFFLPNLN